MYCCCRWGKVCDLVSRLQGVYWVGFRQFICLICCVVSTLRVFWYGVCRWNCCSVASMMFSFRHLSSGFGWCGLSVLMSLCLICRFSAVDGTVWGFLFACQCCGASVAGGISSSHSVLYLMFGVVFSGCLFFCGVWWPMGCSCSYFDVYVLLWMFLFLF